MMPIPPGPREFTDNSVPLTVEAAKIIVGLRVICTGKAASWTGPIEGQVITVTCTADEQWTITAA